MARSSAKLNYDLNYKQINQILLAVMMMMIIIIKYFDLQKVDEAITLRSLDL
jgi:hypothetical protein